MKLCYGYIYQLFSWKTHLSSQRLGPASYLYQGLFQKLKTTSGKDIKGQFCPVKTYKRVATSDLNNPYDHINFKLLLIKQIFERNKSSRTVSESRTQFWLKITPVYKNAMCLQNRWLYGQQGTVNKEVLNSLTELCLTKGVVNDQVNSVCRFT